MYFIEELPFGSETLFRMGNQMGDSIQVLPFAGANLHHVILDNTEVVRGAADMEDFIANKPTFEGAHLVPFPSRISRGKYTIDGNTYSLPHNDPVGDNAIHGLIFNKLFSMRDSRIHTDSAWISFGYKFEGDDGYPFSFDIEVKYILEKASLTLETKILNLSDTSIPMADGWHAYFSLGDSIDDLILELPSDKRMELDDNMIPTGKIQSFKGLGNGLKGIVLDDCFVLNPSDGIQRSILKNENKKLEIWQETGDNGYNFLVIYTPGDRDRIAIEPMTCAPDAFNNGTGLIQLVPEGEVQFRTGIILR